MLPALLRLARERRDITLPAWRILRRVPSSVTAERIRVAFEAMIDSREPEAA